MPNKAIKKTIFTGHFLFLLLIVAIGCVVYANSLKGKFVLDDKSIIVYNPYIKTGLNLSDILKDEISPAGKITLGFYRPVTGLSYRINYIFWKLNPTPYHITNTLLHILTALALYGLVQILFKERLLSLLSAIFFIAHPVQVETVAYISDRADIMVTLFMLLGLVFYIRQIEDKRVFKNTSLLLLCFLTTLLTKENAIIFPALLLVYNFAFKKKPRLGVFAMLFSMGSLYFALRSLFFKTATFKLTSATSTVFQRIPGFFVAITNYIRLLVLPYGLHIDYGRPLFKFTNPQAIFGISLVFIFLVYALFYIFKPKKGSPIIFFAVSWFFVSLLPVSNIYPMIFYMAEHFLYLPSVGFCVILAAGFNRLYKINGYKYYVISLAACLVVVYSILSIAQNRFWREPLETYTRSLKYNPKSTIALNNLSNIYKDMGKNNEALDLLKKALALEPRNVRTLNNLGALYERLGRYEEAMALFKKPIQTDSQGSIPHNNLGAMNEKNRDFDAAIVFYKKSIEINPIYITPYNNLGVIYEKLGKTEEAIALYKKAIEIDPDQAISYNNLGAVYEKQGRAHEAIALYEKAIQLNPDYAKAYYNLGNTYMHQKNFPEAQKAYLKATEEDSEYVDAYYNLGVVYEILREYQKAIESYNKAIKLAPKFVQAYDNLGVAYYRLGKEDKAVELFKKAIVINPRHAKAYDNLCKYYFKQKEYKLAIGYYDKASECGLTNPELKKALEAYR